MSDISRRLMASGGSLNTSAATDSYLSLPNSASTDTGNESFTYEHFPVVCPTCKGQGRVTDDDANVAIIPVEDQRLKPSRLKLKMLTLVVVILISGGLALIFLYPRAVTMTVRKTIPVNYSFPIMGKGSPFITHQTDVEINNLNFFTVSVSHFHAKFIYRQQVVGDFFQNASKVVAIKGSEVYNTKIHAVYKSSNEKFIRQKCYKLQFQFTEEMRISAMISYWYHSERISIRKYVVIDCKHMAFPWHGFYGSSQRESTGITPEKGSTGHSRRKQRSSYLRYLNLRYKTQL